MSHVMSAYTYKIWDEVEMLAIKYGTVNLGHGYADFEPPKIIKDALKEILEVPSSPLIHQYARRFGHERLVRILAKVHQPILGVEIDPLTNVLVTVGATHALFCTMFSMVQPNDEVILFEPYFTSYEDLFKRTKAKPVHVAMKPNKSSESEAVHFSFDKEELESKFSEKTKIFVLNNPNNPTGKVFTLEELEFIAVLCKKYDILVVSDEVYYRLVHPPLKHISIASLPGMWERTMTIGSAGKCFSITGWKMGWCIGPEHYIKFVVDIVSVTTYNVQTPLQEALAIAFENEVEKKNDEDSYVNYASQQIMEKFNRISRMLKSVGMVPIVPEGGYFLLADFSKVQGFQYEEGAGVDKDVQFGRWMMIKYGISCVPLSVFLSDESKKESKYIRLCCYKSEETLRKAEQIFKTWKANLDNNRVLA